METVVLPAQDHLAQERYRYQNRMMSGMIYPLDGLPRTRRKVKTPSQAFAASIHSQIVRVSSNQTVPSVGTRNTPAGAVAQLDLTFGTLRGARFSSSAPTRHLSGMSTPQYRLHSTPSQGFTRSEFARSEATSPVQSKQHPAASPFSPSSFMNGSVTYSSHSVKARSDGELFSGSKKAGEVEKTSERRKSLEKNFENKNGYERKMVERYEKPVDKRKVFDRKSVDKKAAVFKNQDEKLNNPPKKGIITILQRPQTKEAAAENLAKITGIALESLQGVKSCQQTPVEFTRKDVDPVSVVLSTDELQESDSGSKDGESGISHALKGRSGSPKGGKKRSVRGDNNRAPGARANASGVEKVGKASSGSNGHPARVYVEKEDKNKAGEGRREASPVSSNVSKEGSGSSKSLSGNPGVLNLSAEDYSSVHSISDSLLKKYCGRNHPSPDSGRKAGDEHIVKQHGVAKSDSFRDIPRRSESCEVIFLPSSPPTAAAERWAGPAYSNSPPPSTLPFPTFPTQRAKSALNGVLLGALVDPLVPEAVPMKASSAPSSPTRVSSAFLSDHRAQMPRVDPSSATKDLRRILNLDVECPSGKEASLGPMDGFRVPAFLKAKEQQFATQSLKRILQLD